MYIGPLKALINDQFRRIETLCQRIEMPVHRWHGDVGDAAKRRFIENPGGVLLITPESLEAMFVLRPTSMPRIFSRLAYVVIDELHAFIGTERGAQLRSQLERLQRRSGSAPTRVGLSATLGEPALALRWLRPKAAPATLLDDPEASRAMAVRVRGFWAEPKPARALADEPEVPDEDGPSLVPVARAILVAVGNTTNLVFANAKSTIESLADALKQQVQELNAQVEVVVHHGSLSKPVREYAEERLSSGVPCVAVCSNTLEMGIDIGRIESVVQLSAPPSVAALVQRIGRSGREEGDIAQLRAFCIERAPDEDASPWQRLHLNFTAGIAAIELMRERFVEPLDIARSHSSTLIQQILSSLAESGGIHAAKLYEALDGAGAFGGLTKARFSVVLRELGRRALIEQMPGGDLILAPKGQGIIGHYSFYAAFKSVEEVSVFHRSEKIAMLPSDSVPGLGEHLLLAGRRWRVTQIDIERREIAVEPSVGRRPPMFRSRLGDAHPAVHAKMRDVLLAEQVPTYLDDTAKEILASARRGAERLGRFEVPLLAGGDGTLVCLWAGSRISRTLYLVLRSRDVEAEDREVGLDVKATPDEIARVFERFAKLPDDPLALAERADHELGARLVEGQKYDEYLPDEVWLEEYARERLDVAGAVEAARRSLEGMRRD